MARLPVIFSVIFLFALSNASTPLNRPVKDIINGDLPTALSESDAESVIHLPSDNPQPESTTFVRLEPETEADSIETRRVEPAETLRESEAVNGDAIPLKKHLTVFSFHPINRHFRVKRTYPVRYARRDCHHDFKLMKRAGQAPEFRYGNDMILSGENGDFDRPVFRGGMRQIPTRRVRFYHRRQDDDNKNMKSRFAFRNPHHDLIKEKFRRTQHRAEEEEMKKKKEGKKEADQGSFMKRFRKFLNRF